jgi:hypothetical protein
LAKLRKAPRKDKVKVVPNEKKTKRNLASSFMPQASKKKNPSSFFIILASIFKLIRLKILELRYMPHLEVRLVHDKAYAKGGTYKKYTDKPYSRHINRGAVIAFVVSFIVFQGFQQFFPYLSLWNPREVQSASYSKTWTSKEDFQTATTNSNIDFDTTSGSIQLTLPEYNPQGTGQDGPLTVSSAFNLNTQTNGYNGRTAADGVIWTVTNNVTSGQATISSGTSRPTGFAIGDEVMIINLKGTTTDYSNVGLYEFKKVQSLPTSTSITVDSNLTNAYNGTTQKIIVQRVPNYTDVTVNSGQIMTINAWNGTSGGVLAFKVNGELTNNGSIDVTGKGYRGGARSTGSTSRSQLGEWAGGGLVNSGGYIILLL